MALKFDCMKISCMDEFEFTVFRVAGTDEFQLM
jgi:hypothetical protein